MMIVDSHCHLDYENLYIQLDDVVKRAEECNVKCLLTICTTLESFEKIKIIVSKHKNIYGTVGDNLGYVEMKKLLEELE